jgi:adenylate cyclase
VVLPFANLSNDPEQQYFADGITEDVTTDLSQIEGMFVISRNTAFTYQGKRVETKQIGRELGVRYVLEGSVRRSGNQVRVNAQLIDAETDAHLWADRFDRDMGDLFALQNDITSRITIGLNLELISAEAARPTERLDALDFIFRARAAWRKPRSSGTIDEAISLLERALALDPGSVEAQAWLAIMLVSRVLDIGPNSEDADIKRAEDLATKAVAAAPGSALPHTAKAEVLRARRRCVEAIPEFETALGINRNAVGALADMGRCKMFTGHIEGGLRLRSRPSDSVPGTHKSGIGIFGLGKAA